MSDYDKAGRYLIKRDPMRFLRWLLRRPIAFHAWIDARRLALPDQGDLVQDLIAACWINNQLEALCLELEAESAASTAGRLLYGYVPRLAAEPGGLELTAVGGIVINLTGRDQPPTVEQRSQLAPDSWLHGSVTQRSLRTIPAVEVADEIRAGTASWWLLAWLPLLQGGDETAILNTWKELAALEPDGRERGVVAGLTLTFAELGKTIDVWVKALEGWNVIKSPYLEALREAVRADGRAEGRVEGMRELLLSLGRQKFGKAPTKKHLQQLDAITELDRLEALGERLLTVASWSELLAAS